MSSLPIQAVLPDLLRAFNQGHEVVLEAPPGAGKTTQVPLALLNQSWLGEQQIVMLEPRRMAARAAAERMAQLLGENVGETVGYRIRQENKTSHKTRITVVTEGILTRWLQNDPSLEGIGLVIFDEFHERNVDSDLGLALCLQSKSLFRDDTDPLKILVMSATLDGDKIANYLFGAPLIRSEGRLHPVDIRYSHSNVSTQNILDSFAEKNVEENVEKIIEALDLHQGNILVFLPGQGEIKRTAEQLRQRTSDDISIRPLYGSLSLSEQRDAIAPLPDNSPYSRKIVLSTDIAETSLTIEGVSVVIDSGLVRVPEYDPNNGMTRLQTKRISKASSTQRAGRAGRLGPGVCYRLWSESQQQGLADQISPEITHADLTPIALQLLQWGVAHPQELAWLDPPSNGVYDQALALLQQLGAIQQHSDSQVTLTKHGEAMANLATHPRLAHMLLEGEAQGMLSQACNIAAFLAERDPFTHLGADVILRMNILEQEHTCPNALRHWLHRTKKQAKSFAAAFHHQNPTSVSPHHAYALLLAFAYPDRIARKQGHGLYKLSNGRSAYLAAGDALTKQEWLVVVESGGKAGQANDKIYSAIALDANLFQRELAHLIRHEEVITWDDKAGRIIAEARDYLGRLCVKSAPIHNVSNTQIQHALLNHIQNKGLSILPFTAEVHQFLYRVALVKNTLKSDNQSWPDLSEATLISTLENWLAPFLTGVKKMEDLQKLDLITILKSLLPWDLQTTLETLAPEKISVPSGSTLSIDYSQQPPVLAVKLQEMFGCEQTPCILNGQVRLAVHLLSPARRPLQITQDLGNFWRNSYQEVKKEMKGRYPKHPWPDDPLSAEATRFTKKHLSK
ncbi:DEAD-box ATP-dependent RNA helicase RhpA [Thalassocella blandensis]|nr:DEAD-box ATP-dependent RNA helicase RhpA [Thalassocella blandensis]